MRHTRADLLSRNSKKGLWGLVLGAMLLSLPGRASALPSLAEFLTGARKSSADIREAEYAAMERESEATAAAGKLLPSLSISGAYTHNQYDSELSSGAGGSVVIQPHDVLSGNAQITVPILDVQAWKQRSSAQSLSSSAAEAARAQRLEIERQVVRYYYSLIGAEALRRAYAESLAAAEETLSVSREKRDAGAATELDVARAAADVERVRQGVASQEFAVAIARRALTTISGLDAEGEVPELEDDLEEEAALDAWESRVDDDVPRIAEAIENENAAEVRADQARLAFVPTLSGLAREDVTSAAGMLGRKAYFTAALTLTWKFDVSMLYDVRAREGALGAARMRTERARENARDEVHQAWQSVRTGIAKSRAARAESEQAEIAVAAARERYEAGSGTQLDLIQARRDLVSAQASRIQADADLSYARMALRLAAGEPSEGGTR